MTGDPAVAVLDVGKSNVKLALVDTGTREVIAIRTVANTVLPGPPYPHFNVERLWAWLIEGLAELGERADIVAISTAAHGSCLALVAGDGLALPILDYEHDGPESVREAYAQARGDFSETLSPDLPNGLNAGRQLYWQARAFPEAFARTEAILFYPQYWAWRLTGEKAVEATSLGCHTDLWNPRAGSYSRLAEAEGWTVLLPRLVTPFDVVGTIRPEVAAKTGLSRACRVLAGIHDSNASLLPHILSRPLPFAVLSTGTWMVVFAPGGSIDRLDSERDCLANVDALGRPVPSARFMAGREYEIVAGGGAEPSEDDVRRVVDEAIMALPTFAPGIGPFGSSSGRWSRDPSSLAAGERAAVASLYAALVAETCLGLAGADGPAIVEGPFSRNRVFLAALASLTRRPVIARPDATGTTDGAALLYFGRGSTAPLRDPPPVRPLSRDISAYARAWRERASG